MAQLLLDFTPEFQELVNYWSSRNNETPEAFMKNIIAEYLEDLKDYEDAARICEGVRAGTIKTYSLQEVEQHLDMLDMEESQPSLMDKYERIIYWSDKDNKFIAEVPELPGCMADGGTPEEALENSGVIISEWIETAKLLGREIPEPAGKLVNA